MGVGSSKIAAPAMGTSEATPTPPETINAAAARMYPPGFVAAQTLNTIGKVLWIMASNNGNDTATSAPVHFCLGNLGGLAGARHAVTTDTIFDMQ